MPCNIDSFCVQLSKVFVRFITIAIYCFLRFFKTKKIVPNILLIGAGIISIRDNTKCLPTSIKLTC